MNPPCTAHNGSYYCERYQGHTGLHETLPSWSNYHQARVFARFVDNYSAVTFHRVRPSKPLGDTK